MDAVPPRIGRYELVRQLGQGGMGVVWEAVLHGPEGFRKPVALKLLRAGKVDPAHRRALAHEARLGALLGHPNVVVTHDLGEADGHWYVAMELVRGASLGDLVAVGPLSGEAVLDVGVQTCAGLARIHALAVPPIGPSSSREPRTLPPEAAGGETTWLDGPTDEAPRPASTGAVHRDVKPANLLLDVSGLVKVADLGLARLASGSAPRGGTPGYLAPEQRWGREDARADQFALGVTLVELATGRLPFGEGQEALRAVADSDALIDTVAFEAAVDAAVPGLASVLRRCLRADPDRRFEDIEAMGAALAALRPRQRPGISLLERLARVRPELAPATASALSTPRIGQLPPEPDPLLGRDGLVGEVVDQVLGGARVVTVTGPAGVGKSRVALAAAHRLDDRLPGGAVRIRADARSVDALCVSVAGAVGAELSGPDPVEQVGRLLRDRGRLLVVLDDLEALATEAGRFLGRWQELAPEARFLATSRVLLRVAGEVTVAVGPLEPDDAVALFRRKAPRPPSDAELADVRTLVEALDHLPLAIELAASRTRTLPVAGLLRHLDDRLRLLAGGDRDRPDRQRSLRAALDGSWELLSADGRRALAQLSVFEDPFTLESAEAVLDLGPEGPWPLDLLQELVESSVLAPRPDGRFRMLGVVREHAAERGADEVGPAEIRHGRAFAGRFDPTVFDGPGGGERLRTGARELRDWSAACARAVARGDVEVAVPTVFGVTEIGRHRGSLRATTELLQGVLGLGLPIGPRVQVLRALSRSLRSLGRGREAEAAHEALAALLPEATHPRDRARILIHLANRHLDHHRVAEALPLAEEALALFRALGDRKQEAVVLANRALMERRSGTGDPAATYEEALRLLRACGDQRTEAQVVTHHATLLRELGRDEEAVACLERSLALHEASGTRRYACEAHGNLAQVLTDLGRPEEALRHVVRALGIARELGDRHLEAQALHDLAWATRTTDPERARRACEEALPVLREVDDAREVGAVLLTLSGLGDAGARLRSAEEAAALGRARGMRDVECRAELRLGDLRAELGEGEAAQACWRRAEALAVALEQPALVAQAQGRLGGPPAAS